MKLVYFSAALLFAAIVSCYDFDATACAAKYLTSEMHIINVSHFSDDASNFSEIFRTYNDQLKTVIAKNFSNFAPFITTKAKETEFLSLFMPSSPVLKKYVENFYDQTSALNGKARKIMETLMRQFESQNVIEHLLDALVKVDALYFEEIFNQVYAKDVAAGHPDKDSRPIYKRVEIWAIFFLLIGAVALGVSIFMRKSIHVAVIYAAGGFCALMIVLVVLAFVLFKPKTNNSAKKGSKKNSAKPIFKVFTLADCGINNLNRKIDVIKNEKSESMTYAPKSAPSNKAPSNNMPIKTPQQYVQYSENEQSAESSENSQPKRNAPPPPSKGNKQKSSEESIDAQIKKNIMKNQQQLKQTKAPIKKKEPVKNVPSNRNNQKPLPPKRNVKKDSTDANANEEQDTAENDDEKNQKEKQPNVFVRNYRRFKDYWRNKFSSSKNKKDKQNEEDEEESDAEVVKKNKKNVEKDADKDADKNAVKGPKEATMWDKFKTSLGSTWKRTKHAVKSVFKGKHKFNGIRGILDKNENESGVNAAIQLLLHVSEFKEIFNVLLENEENIKSKGVPYATLLMNSFEQQWISEGTHEFFENSFENVNTFLEEVSIYENKQKFYAAEEFLKQMLYGFAKNLQILVKKKIYNKELFEMFKYSTKLINKDGSILKEDHSVQAPIMDVVIYDDKVPTLERALEHFFKRPFSKCTVHKNGCPRTAQGNNGCKTVSGTLKNTPQNFPKTLFIKLDKTRLLRSNSNNPTKPLPVVQYPRKALQFWPGYTYDLAAVLCRVIEEDTTSYYVLAKRDNDWYVFRDDKVLPFTQRTVRDDPNAFILVYEQVSSKK